MTLLPPSSSESTITKSEPYRWYHINNSVINVYFGDILTSNSEVIVNSISNELGFKSSLSDAIGKIAGEQVSKDVKKLLPVNVGSVIVTTAGLLKQKYLFHVVWGKDQRLEKKVMEGTDDVNEYILTHSLRRCFALMKTLNLESIAIPCIGAGRMRIPKAKIAKCMAKQICNFLMATSKAITVNVYLHEVNDKKDRLEFLPFFEWFASYSHIARKEIETLEEPEDLKIGEIELKDTLIKQAEKPDVFISYSRKDNEMAKVICSILNQLGKSYWIDTDSIDSGDNYKQKIVTAIQEAKIVLFLSSENSNRSKHVAKEISIADKYDKVIIPVKLDEAQFNPKMDYDLSGIDAIDFNRADEKSVIRLRSAVLGQLEMSKR